MKNLDEELSNPAMKYTPPYGEILVAVEEDKVVGMVAYHRHSDTRCEMKFCFMQYVPVIRRWCLIQSSH